MNESNPLVIGAIAIIAGILVILFKEKLGRGATRLYKRMGIEVPQQLYAKQFGFIGILLMLLGFLIGTGLLDAIIL